MKLRSIVSLIIVAFVAIQGVAQKKELTLQDAVLKQYRDFYPKSIPQLAWVPTTSNYAFVNDNNDLIEASIGKRADRIIATLSDLNRAASLELERFPRISWKSSNEFAFFHEGAIYSYDIQAKTASKIMQLPADAEHLDVNFEGKKAAYTKSNNLFIFDRDGSETQVTFDEEKHVVNGQSVHRNEFGISKGTFWSPSGMYLAFYRKNEAKVTTYPLVDITTVPATLNEIRYPMAGQKSEEVELGVYNTKTNRLVYIKPLQNPENYLTNISFSPDNQHVFIAHLNRDQNELHLNMYSAETSELIRTLYTEKHDKYVHPQHALEFWQDSENECIWRSDKDGFNHLYLLNLKNNEITQLSSGKFVVDELIGFDSKGKYLYFKAYSENGLNHVLYRTDKKGNQKVIYDEPGTFTAELSGDANYFIINRKSIDTPRKIEIIDTRGKTIKELANEADPLADYNIAQTELIQIKAADGKTDLNARIIKPSDFNPKKKYPVLVYVYGGPNVQLLTNTYLAGASLWMHYLANQGYIIFTVDSRGSSNRGMEFEQATFRQLGTVEVADQMKGVEYLKKQKYVDENRIAVHGWSFGGFMTTSLMLKQPGVFTCGVAGGPVIDWKFYEIMYTERYMDTPQQNPEGYEQASLLNYTKNLEGKLLLIHGSIDDVVVPQHSMQFLKTCVDNGVQVDFFTYPMHPHNVRGKDRVHLIEKVIEYVELYNK